jgi:transcription elongation factor GreA
MEKKTVLTREGKEKLEEELETLKVDRRDEVAEKLKEARAQGDLSENAEYDAAKEAQGHLEARISKLQDLVANARLLDESKIDVSKVLLLSKITIRNIKNNMKQSYTIVPESEANLKEAKISVTSPFAQAFLGKRAGEKVDVVVPAGKMQFEILSVER